VIDGMADRAEEIHVLGTDRGRARAAAHLARRPVRDATAVLDHVVLSEARRGRYAHRVARGTGDTAAQTDAPRPESPGGAQEHAKEEASARGSDRLGEPGHEHVE